MNGNGVASTRWKSRILCWDTFRCFGVGLGRACSQQSGSGYAVKAVTRCHGPSERITDDLSNLDLSTMNIVTGQSGNFMSPYYMDQWKAWHEGTTFSLPYSSQAVENSKTHRLSLQPASGR